MTNYADAGRAAIAGCSCGESQTGAVGSIARFLGKTPTLVGGSRVGTRPGVTVMGTRHTLVGNQHIVGADGSGMFSPMDQFAQKLAGSFFDPANVFGYPAETPDAWKQQQSLDYVSFIYGIEAGALKGAAVGGIAVALGFLVLPKLLGKKGKR